MTAAALPRLRPGLADTIARVVLVAFAILVVSLHVHAFPKLSPIDEPSHLDYLFRASHGHVVHTGQRWGEQTMNAVACRGLQGSYRPPPCHATHVPTQFPGKGFSTADVHPPTYYFLTAAAARVLTGTGITHDFVTAGRLVGALWLAVGLLLVYAAARRIGAGPLGAGAVGLLLATSPTLLSYIAVVTPDGAALAAGGAVVWAAIAWEQGRLHWAWLVVAGAFAASVKAPFAMASLAMAVYLVGRWWLETERGARPLLRPRIGAALALLGGSMFAQVAWLVFRAATRSASAAQVPMHSGNTVGALTVREVVSETTALLRPLTTSVYLNRWPLIDVQQVFYVVTIAAAAGAVLYVTRTQLGALGAATLAGYVVAGPILVLATYTSESVFVALPVRYGLGLLAALATTTAAALRPLWAQVAMAALALVGVGYLLAVLA